jgi:hypothetical protein
MIGKKALLLAFFAATLATAGRAAEMPEQIAASKCSGKRKAFGFIDDPTAPRRPHKFRMGSANYFQAGSIAVQACKTFRGRDSCQELLSLGFILSPGFTGELPCGAGGGVQYVTYSRSTPDGTATTFWSADTDCVITIVKNDTERGRIKGTIRGTFATTSDQGDLTAPLVGCFSARRRDL